MNTDTKNKTTTAEANQPQSTANEEILTLLRKIVGQTATNESNASDNTGSNYRDAQDNTMAEINRLLEELQKKQTNNDLTTETANDDLDEVEDDDNEPNDSDDGSVIIADPDSDLETLGFIAGGAALVGLGALLYHCLKD